MRRRFGLWLGLGAAALVAAASTAPAMARPAWQNVEFTAQFDDPGSRVAGIGGVDPDCPPGYMHLEGQAQFHRPLQAVDNYWGCILPVPDPSTGVMPGDTWDKQTGWLAGCGWGSFVMHQRNFRVASEDPVTRTFRLTLDWTLESGTGAFRGASGKGTGFADFTAPTPASFPGLPNSGTYAGAITCPHHG